MSGVTVTKNEGVEGINVIEVSEGNFKRDQLLQLPLQVPLETPRSA